MSMWVVRMPRAMYPSFHMLLLVWCCLKHPDNSSFTFHSVSWPRNIFLLNSHGGLPRKVWAADIFGIYGCNWNFLHISANSDRCTYKSRSLFGIVRVSIDPWGFSCSPRCVVRPQSFSVRCPAPPIRAGPISEAHHTRQKRSHFMPRIESSTWKHWTVSWLFRLRRLK
jgi:hypothetical protein